ncbi:hypothetical protein [Glycomyces sp. NPDC047010]|uniref:phage terminase small subunit n=1 Tax=Glycomyces sp. NPDC047010 TaxID=3155023 RepID=UPI0033CA8263
MTHPKPEDGKLGRHKSLAETAAVDLAAIPHARSDWDFGDLGRLKHKTRQWLISVMSSPQAALYQVTDIQRIRDLLPLKDAYYAASGDPELLIKLARTIKPLEDSLLFSHVDRSKVGIRYAPVIEGEKAEPDDDGAVDAAFS